MSRENVYGARWDVVFSLRAVVNLDLSEPEHVLCPGKLLHPLSMMYMYFSLHEWCAFFLKGAILVSFFVPWVLLFVAGEFDIVLCVDNSESTASRKYVPSSNNVLLISLALS